VELTWATPPENAAEFGVTQGGNPQVRLLALIECGTHALIDAAFDGVTKASEHKLARRLLHALDAGMLLLADRNFAGHELWGMVAATGSDMLWRIKKNLVFPPVEILPDGSFLSIMPTPAENLRHGVARARGHSLGRTPHGHLVRIIEYTITIKTSDGRTRTEPFRLVTTLLNHEQAPAAEIAAVYHERWEIENGYGELKTRLRGAAFILRSKLPELVCQELFALLTVYQALCSLKCEAALTIGIDPDRISFTATVRVVQHPDFATKAARVLDLYQRIWDGQSLAGNEYVISCDEKTSIQARCRCHPTLPPGTARKMRIDHEYDRRGSLAYLAAYDVHHARVIGHCAAKTGIVPFMTLVEKVMNAEPYASAKRVFWVADNGSSHRGKAAADRLTAQFPNAVMVHTPVHASWLNQIEIFFSIVQRKVVTPNDFTGLDQVEDRLIAFERRYNETAQPFRWKFTRPTSRT
jgi:hypothetical protein